MKEIEGFGSALSKIACEPSAQGRYELCTKLLDAMFPILTSVLLQADERPSDLEDELIVVGEVGWGGYQLTDKGRAVIESSRDQFRSE